MRRRIFLAFATLVVGVLGLLVGSVFVLTRTDWGLGKVTQLVMRRVNSGIHGRLHLGRLGGTIFTGFTLDTLELRDAKDSLFLAVGRLEVSYDPRDLLDRRILMHQVRIGSLAAQVFEDSVGMINIRRIFESDRPPAPQPAAPPRRSWGHFIKVEDVVVDLAQFTLTTRWNPSDLLGPAVRDSVIRFNLERPDKEIWRGPGVYYETRRFTQARLELDSARLDDRQTGGRTFAIRRASIRISDPPFDFRHLAGALRLRGDSIWAEVPQFSLPGSRGTISGRVWGWASGPARFDLAVRSDSVSLADVAWVYPTLPTTGGGRVDLLIRSEQDPRIIDYILSNMDVRSRDSRLRGAMTFGVGAPITIVKDVDLAAQPLDFRLVEQLAGEPLPYPWRGQITGTILASGGPLDSWMVDEADVVFRDANVPGAVTIGKARGRMNILEPSEVVFNGLNVELDQLDLRTLQFLVPAFPRLNGHIAGRAVLDSLWTDVRFREADIRHTDGSGPATRMLGAGRVTFEETYTAYDVALSAQPLSFTTFSRAYSDSHIPLKGEYEGPMRLFGTAQDLAVTTQLRGPAGMIGYDGRVDGDSLGGYALDGVVTAAGLDLRTLLDTAITPVTDLWGRATLNVTFDSLLTLAGSATMEVDRHSRFDSILVYGGSRARMRFADGVARVLAGDTITYAAGRVIAEGGIGLGAGYRDSMLVEVQLDTLGGVRPYLGVAPEDTLHGSVTAQLRLRGSIDTLGIGGWVRAEGLAMPGLQARSVHLTPALTDVLGAVDGRLDVRADTAVLGGVSFRRLAGDLVLEAGRTGQYALFAEATDSSTVASGGALAFEGDTTTIRVDSLALALGASRYRLERPARVRMEPARFATDSLLLAGPGGARLAFAVDAPDRATMTARIGVRGLDLEDLSRALQTDLQLRGELSGSVTVAGTRDQPRIIGSATLGNVGTGELRVARVEIDGSYADRRLRGTALVTQADTTVLTMDASIPVDLAIRSRESRLLDDTLRVSVRSPEVQLSVLESFTTAIRGASGTFSANMELSGPRQAAELNGTIAVTRGRATLPTMGITLRDIHARIRANEDTLRVDSLSMVSGPEDDDALAIRGFVAHPLDTARVAFDLGARAAEFHAIGLERQVADLYIDANVTWVGTDDASRAGGAVTVQRGSIALPETTDKELFPIINWRELGLDSTDVRALGLLPSQASVFLRGLAAEDVRIVMGPDVWLRSEDAAIKLAGAVNLSVSRVQGTGTLSEDQLVLRGDLQTERGTYRLNVSPLQRIFFVESGRLRFDGTTRGFNPDLDIRAVYTARLIEANYGGRNDVRVGAHITGSLVNPSLYLYSADSLSFLTEPDLWSYVLFNRPSFAVGGWSDTDFAVSLLLGTASSMASAIASRYAGGLLDYVQLQTSTEASLFGVGGSRNIWEGAQLGFGRQVGDRLFVTATSGLCQIKPQAGSSWLLESLGMKLEYRFGRASPAGASASYEPSFDKLTCGAANVGFSSQRKQVGIDIFRVWRR